MNLVPAVLSLVLVFFYMAPVRAQWQTPVNLGPDVNSAADEFRAALSADGATLIFDSNRIEAIGDFDLFASTDTGGTWSAPVNLGPAVNTAGRDYAPALSPDGLTLYFTSGGWDLVQSQWTGSEWGPRQPVPGSVNSGSQEWAPFLSADGARLYFTAWNRPGGAGGHDLWSSAWNGGSWGVPSPVAPNVNGAGNEYTGSITADGSTMYLSLDGDIYRSTDSAGTWTAPVSLGPAVNAPDRWDTNPTISADGTALYFSSERDGGFGGYDLYVTTNTATGADPPVGGPVALTNRLLAPTPNPFARTARLGFEVASPRHVTLRVFDVRGRAVATIVDAPVGPGRHTASWAGRDSRGVPVSSGVYFARMRAGDFEEVRRMVLLR